VIGLGKVPDFYDGWFRFGQISSFRNKNNVWGSPDTAYLLV
jgi:hypothetical protein